MKLIIYSIFDVKAKAYNRPFLLLNDDIALRTATDLVSDPSSDIHRHPEDFTMFKLGDYDDSNACFDIHDSPIPLYRFHELQASLPIDQG